MTFKEDIIEDIKMWKTKPWRPIVGFTFIAIEIYWFIKIFT